MSKRNVAWLIAVVAVGAVVWITAGVLWGLLAAAVTLAASELLERSRRKRLRAARGETSAPSLKDAVTTRRKRR
jgi:hypothetical protein